MLDISTVIMGPYATAQLGDLGADVIKAERPEGTSRGGWAPPAMPE